MTDNTLIRTAIIEDDEVQRDCLRVLIARDRKRTNMSSPNSRFRTQ
jgi:hypothetical protein